MASINLTRVTQLFQTPTTEQPYICTKGAFSLFLNDIVCGDINGYALSNLFQDHASYVVRALFFPFDLTKLYNYTLFTDNTYNIKIGKIDVNASTYSYDDSHRVAGVSDLSTSGTKPKWFEVNVTRTYNNFLDFAPYTKIFLQVPFFGLIEIEPIDAYVGTLSAYLIVDIRSGSATLYIENSNGMIVEKTSRVGVNISLGKTNAEEIERNNVLQTISFISQVGVLAGGIASGNAVATGSGLALMTKTVTDAINNNVTRLTSLTGSGDSRDKQCQANEIYLIIEQPQNVSVPQLSIKGGVCRKNLALSGVTGYTEIGQIIFNPNNSDIYNDEINEITELLRDGVIL